MNIKNLSGVRCLVTGLFSAKDAEVTHKIEHIVSLIEQSNGIVVGEITQRRGVSRSNKPGGSKPETLGAPMDSATYLGKGKVRELKELAALNNAELIVIANKLSNTQMKNLAEKTNCKVISI